jgi:hypothetical protein
MSSGHGLNGAGSLMAFLTNITEQVADGVLQNLHIGDGAVVIQVKSQRHLAVRSIANCWLSSKSYQRCVTASTSAASYAPNGVAFTSNDARAPGGASRPPASSAGRAMVRLLRERLLDGARTRLFLLLGIFRLAQRQIARRTAGCDSCGGGAGGRLKLVEIRARHVLGFYDLGLFAVQLRNVLVPLVGSAAREFWLE